MVSLAAIAHRIPIGWSMLVLIGVLALLSLQDGASGTEVGGRLETDTTWTLEGSPYIIRDALDIKTGVVLRIGPGVEVLMGRGTDLNDNYLQTGDGTLVIEGTVDRPVLFRVIPSDLPDMYKTTAVFSGPDGDLRNATFEGIFLSIDGGTTASYCIIRNQHQGEVWKGSVGVDSGTSLYRCEVWDCDNGFYVTDSSGTSIQLRECKAFDSLVGFYIRQSNECTNTVTVTGCTALGCERGFDVYNSGSTSRLVGCLAIDCDIGFNLSSNHDFRLVDCAAVSCTVGFKTVGHTTKEADVLLDGFLAQSCEAGIYMRFPAYTEISNGSFNSNTISIHIENYNTFYPNKRFYIVIWDNNFVGGSVEFTNSKLQPNWTRDGRGNYWSNYPGPDADMDGIGDIPYTIAADNVDNFPLMERTDHTPPLAFAGRPVVANQSEEFVLDGRRSADDLAIGGGLWTVHLPSGDALVLGLAQAFTIQDSGDYLATLKVTGLEGDEGTDWCRIHIRDSEAPAFSDLVLPANGFTGQNVTLGCAITDNIGVSRAWASYLLDDGQPWRTANMSRNRDGGWNLSVWIPAQLRGSVAFRYGAVDREGNSNETDQHTFGILDDIPPTVRMPTIMVDFKTGTTVDIICQAEDNWAVSGVVMEYWFDGGGPALVPMSDMHTKWGGWNATLSIPHNDTSGLHFRFNATDASGNRVLTGTMDIDVVDGESPVITEVMTTDTFHRGETNVFSVEVRDCIGVAEVELRFRMPGDEVWNYTPMQLEGGLYVARVALPRTGASSLDYYFRAQDGAGNWNTSGTRTAQVRSPGPHIGPMADTDAWEGTPVSLTLSVWDLDGVPGEHQWALQSFVPWVTINQDTGELHGTPERTSIGAWTVEVMVTDLDGNSDVVSFNITVHDVNFAPTVSITSPGDGLLLKATTTVSGTASDDDRRIDWVRARINGGAWMNATGTATWTIVLNPKTLEAGEHKLEVMAYDGFNESAVAELAFMTEKERTDDGPGFEGQASIIGIMSIAALYVLSRRGGQGRAD